MNEEKLDEILEQIELIEKLIRDNEKFNVIMHKIVHMQKMFVESLKGIVNEIYKK